MVNEDLLRSYRQYVKQKEMGHLRLNTLHKIFLALLFIPTGITNLVKVYYAILRKGDEENQLFIFPFNSHEPMKTIVKALSRSKHSKVIVRPRAPMIAPLLLYRDFIICLMDRPWWTIRNLDFFGALALKVAQYYGYKVKYHIKYLMLFQEYSFYSSYLTHVFEDEEGALYNLMHGMPGEEASFFRFSKCFIWGEYFEQFYLKHGADAKQFVVVGSLFHQYLMKEKGNYEIKFDIVYALQGESYSNTKYTRVMIGLLESLQNELRINIAIKPHPRYHESIQTSLEIISMSPIEAIGSTKMIVGQFSTMLLDAKIAGKKVFAFLPEEKKSLVEYLDADEIAFEASDAYNKIKNLMSTDCLSASGHIVAGIDTVAIIEQESVAQKIHA